MAEHVDLTDPELHEPKGAAAASANTVYVADGAGSGTWQSVDVAVLDYTDLSGDLQDDLDDGTIEINAKFYILIKIADVSTAETVIVPVRQDCKFIGATSILGGAITVADASISFKNAAGSSMGTAMTVAYTSSGLGDIDTFTATANNDLVAPTYMTVETDGGSTTAAALSLLLEFTGTLN